MKLIVATVLLCVALAGCCTSDLDTQWEAVVSSGGCMMGHDDWIPADGTGSWEGWSVSPCWKRITTGEPAKVIPFLIAKLPSRLNTGVHVDPFDAAIEGELAVYALQHTTRKNWYEYQGDNKKLTSAMKKRRTRERQASEKYLDYPNDQVLLQDVLTDQQAREALKQFFSNGKT